MKCLKKETVQRFDKKEKKEKGISKAHVRFNTIHRIYFRMGISLHYVVVYFNIYIRKKNPNKDTRKVILQLKNTISLGGGGEGKNFSRKKLHTYHSFFFKFRFDIRNYKRAIALTLETVSNIGNELILKIHFGISLR